MRKQRFLAVLLSAALAFTPVIDVMAEENVAQTEEGSSTGKTEESGEVNQTEVGEENNEPQNYGAIISEISNNVPVYENDVEAYTELPASYQLDKEKYPDVRNQGSYGTCWAFAALGLSEFDLVNKGLADKNIDLSELQLAYFVYNSAVDPLGGTEGDQSKYYNDSTSYSYLNRGGMYEYAVRRLSQWSGAVNESDVPYNTVSINNVLNYGLSDEYAYGKDVAHLENAYVMSLKNNSDDVKRAIMDKGAVGVQYYHSDNRLLWNDNKQVWTYYDPNITGGGHNVMIVGWDDDFSTDNFVGDKPANNGAWLIRNSWGFTKSYFWMSYENKSLLDAAWAFDMNTADNYDNNYQLDGGINSYNVSDQICYYKTYSNVFNVQSKEGVTSEILKAVSLSFTHVANVNYKVEVYTDLKNSNPYSGTKQEAATTEGTTTYAGLYTVPLEQSIQLTPGSSFSVVVTTDKYSLDYEQGIKWANGNVKVWDALVSLNNGKSFFGTSNYQWPWKWGNFCIKAFTSNNTTKESTDAKLVGRSLTLNGSIDVNFYMELSDEIINKPDTYMQFIMENGRTSKVMMNQATARKVGDKIYYGFSCPVYAKEMTDQVTAQLFVDGTGRDEYSYSVQAYAKELLNSETIYSKQTVDAVKAMLNYGAAAQQQFNYKADNLTNAILSNEDRVVSAVPTGALDSYKDTVTTEENIKGISYYGSSLILTSETTVRHYFRLEPGYNISDFLASYSNEEGKTVNLDIQKWSEAEDLYYVEISGIKAHKLNQCPVVMLKESQASAGNGIEIKYGPFSYAKLVAEKDDLSTNSTLKNVVNSLYWYWYYADEYVRS